MNEDHISYMQSALAEAQKGLLEDEVPVGAVLVSGSGVVLAAAHNQSIRLSDPTAHAEILALRQGGRRLDNYRLLNSTLYVTVEPCPMCMGAIIQARVALLVFGTPDPKGGAAGSLYDFPADIRFNHQPRVIQGVCAEECKALLQAFFRSKRDTIIRSKE